MATTSHDHKTYQMRLDYVQQLLRDHLGLSSEDLSQTKVTPVQYEPDAPFKYNNFIYRLSLPIDIAGGFGNIDEQPGCVPIPAEARDFILRLSNPDAADMHQETRVQNEVGMLFLASAALCHIKPAVVPRVFSWRAAAGREHLGWILEELMPGVPLVESFNKTMTFDQRKTTLVQIAGLLKGLQDYPLPESIKGLGGVTFDDSGTIVSASMPCEGAGPWSSYEDFYKSSLKKVLTDCDNNPYLQGWRANGVRDRVDLIIEHGLSAQFSGFISRNDRSIIHADLGMSNLLCDPTTGCITALLDFDYAGILHPVHEFLRSFVGIGGQLCGWLGDTDSHEKEATALLDAKLTGHFPSPLPPSSRSDNGSGIDWEVAQAWEDELEKLNVKRPSTMLGIEKVARVDQLLDLLLPWRLSNEDFLSRHSDEDQRVALRRTGERKLIGLLDRMGF